LLMRDDSGGEGGSYSYISREEDEGTIELQPPNSNTRIWLGWGYVTMCVAFSLCQGVSSATIALGVAYAGDLGSVSAGVTFACHTVSCLLAAPGVCQRLGGKWSLVVGCMLMSTYVLSYFALQLQDPALTRTLILSGSVLGGLGTSLGWTAEGVYMTQAVRRFAREKNVHAAKVSGWASGVFASIALGGEVTVKACATPIDEGSPAFLFLILAVVAFAGSFAMFTVPNLDPRPHERGGEAFDDEKRRGSSDGDSDEDRGEGDNKCWNGLRNWGKIVATVSLLRNDRRIGLFFPFNLTFGLVLAFLNFYVIGQIAKRAYGEAEVGVIASLKPASASLLAVPWAFVARRVGKKSMIVFASLNYLAVALICLLTKRSVLENSKALVAVLCIIAGSGRAVFEGPNKGLLSDIFHNNVEGAFGNVMFQSGFGATLGFFLYPHISVGLMTTILTISSAVSILGIYAIDHEERRPTPHTFQQTRSSQSLDSVGIPELPDHKASINVQLRVQDDYFAGGEVGQRMRSASFGVPGILMG